MDKKVRRYIRDNIGKCLIVFCIFSVILGITISLLPEIVVGIFLGFLVLLMVDIIVVYSCKEKQEKQQFQSMDKKDCQRKWEYYVEAVNKTINETNYSHNKLNEEWIQTFNQFMYDIGTKQFWIDDFDIAACLMFSLVEDKDDDDEILFAFECAKKIISEPREYSTDLGYGYKLDLDIENILPKVNIDIPDTTLTSEAISSLIRPYLMLQKEKGISKLSDFLQILYFKCT